MTITSSGAKCDVCGNYILPIIDIFGEPEMVHSFGITGIAQELHCDNTCKKLLEGADGDWKKLPSGPLKKAFEKELGEE